MIFMLNRRLKRYWNSASPRSFPLEVVQRAVRMVFDAKDQYPLQWAAISAKIDCAAETLWRWVRQGERDGLAL
jgi:transposase